MIIKNAKLEKSVADIKIENGVITGIGDFTGDEEIDAAGRKVIPGLIDIHVHGFGGYDTSDIGRLGDISVKLAEAGTTSWLPTTMTDSIENLIKVTNQPLAPDGANIIGFHLEGPYISKKRKGAQNEKYIKNPDTEEFRKLKNVNIVTVAPELCGAEKFIKNCNAVVSIGHTDCDYSTAVKAIEAGAMCLTHTFDAMPPMLHREPGPIGAAFEKGIYAEVICDGRHVSKTVFLALYKMFTSDRLILISDAIRPAGLEDGKYSSGGLDVHMNGGVLTLKDGTLAGGSGSLLDGVKKAVSFGVDFYEAVKMASQTPADLLKLNKGRIEKGYDADLVILNDDLNVRDVIVGGKVFKSKILRNV
ncbi:MAG: N-acetylglucosamine-6-phosphate deacetylase [Clostridia bacterium]|nr:N-acetylglucosamine-6-phosphate deacetylase [Clostridia bacterium]